MKKIAVALAVLTLAAPAMAADMATMVVTGRAEVAAAPDMATIRVGVVTHDVAAARALEQNSAQLERVLSVLSRAGVASGDMQTSRFQIDPIWTNRSYDSQDPARIEGYEVSNALSVQVMDLDSLGGVLDAVARAGANDFNGIEFGLEDPSPVQDEARRAAVADAMARAELYAEAAGVEIRRVVGISEGGTSSPVMRADTMAMPVMNVPVAQGTVSVSAQVTITYEIE
ncbi:SIMPL domain-containing protein [Nioella nitratireducens]|uniref:SIMPL domain-containing protein n=1 Tax=Nioella nitratireducens TaxID=1287720 RepID=UPI0008FD1619|nr:SIMPL domain-containing protein [Nioella nitratireducens]